MTVKRFVGVNVNENVKGDLCPICKDGQKCSDILGHAGRWNVK